MISLTTQTGFLKPIAWLLGQIFNGLFNLIYTIAGWFTDNPYHVPIIGISVILFTFVVRLILLPMTIKQQRFSKLSSVMNPELQQIQAKYKDKRDQVSMMNMQAETKAVYEKYGTSPTGGCLTMLIQLPIMFALYRVIYKIPGYVTRIKYLCAALSVAVTSTAGWNTDGAYTETGKEKSGIFYNYETEEGSNAISTSTNNKIIDTFYNMSDNKWEIVEKQEVIIDKDGKMSLVLKEAPKDDTEESNTETKKEDTLKEGSTKYTVSNLVLANKTGKTNEKWTIIGLSDNSDYYIYDSETDTYKKSTADELNQVKDQYKVTENIESIHKELKGYNNLFGISLTEAPGWKISWALLIPILAGLTQWLSAKLMENKRPTVGNQDDAQAGMNSSLKIMNTIMPIMSAVFCVTFASCIGLYWIASSVVQIIVQIVINKKMDSMDVEEMIKVNIEKANIKREKKGLPPTKISNVTSNYVEQVKKMEARNARKEERAKEIEESTSYYNTSAKPGSLAAKANMVKMFNEKNNNSKKENK